MNVIFLIGKFAKINIFLAIFSIMMAHSNHFDSIRAKESIEWTVPLLPNRQMCLAFYIFTILKLKNLGECCMWSWFCIKWNIWLYLTKSSFSLVGSRLFTFFSLFHCFIFQNLPIRFFNVQVRIKLLIIHCDSIKLIGIALASSLILRSELLKSLRIWNWLELIFIWSIFKKAVYRHFYNITLFLYILYVIKCVFVRFFYILCFLFKLVSSK